MGMNRTFKAAAALIVAVSFAGPVAAGPYEDGLAAYIKGDHATALRLWRPLAEQGFAGAKFFLGMMYVVGQDVPQDYVTAHMWFDLAAAGGYKDTAPRKAVEYLMTPAQIAEAQKLAREWKPAPP
jgi:TPR repeat protein